MSEGGVDAEAAVSVGVPVLGTPARLRGAASMAMVMLTAVVMMVDPTAIATATEMMIGWMLHVVSQL